MMYVFTTLVIKCSNPQIINLTNEWNELDQSTFYRATKRCSELFQDAPCLRKFIKKEELVYNVVCGNANTST